MKEDTPYASHSMQVSNQLPASGSWSLASTMCSQTRYEGDRLTNTAHSAPFNPWLEPNFNQLYGSTSSHPGVPAGYLSAKPHFAPEAANAAGAAYGGIIPPSIAPSLGPPSIIFNPSPALEESGAIPSHLAVAADPLTLQHPGFDHPGASLLDVPYPSPLHRHRRTQPHSTQRAHSAIFTHSSFASARDASLGGRSEGGSPSHGHGHSPSHGLTARGPPDTRTTPRKSSDTRASATRLERSAIAQSYAQSLPYWPPPLSMPHQSAATAAAHYTGPPQAHVVLAEEGPRESPGERGFFDGPVATGFRTAAAAFDAATAAATAGSPSAATSDPWFGPPSSAGGSGSCSPRPLPPLLPSGPQQRQQRRRSALALGDYDPEEACCSPLKRVSLADPAGHFCSSPVRSSALASAAAGAGAGTGSPVASAQRTPVKHSAGAAAAPPTGGPIRSPFEFFTLPSATAAPTAAPKSQDAAGRHRATSAGGAASAAGAAVAAAAAAGNAASSSAGGAAPGAATGALGAAAGITGIGRLQQSSRPSHPGQTVVAHEGAQEPCLDSRRLALSSVSNLEQLRDTVAADASLPARDKMNLLSLIENALRQQQEQQPVQQHQHQQPSCMSGPAAAFSTHLPPSTDAPILPAKQSSTAAARVGGVSGGADPGPPSVPPLCAPAAATSAGDAAVGALAAARTPQATPPPPPPPAGLAGPLGRRESAGGGGGGAGGGGRTARRTAASDGGSQASTATAAANATTAPADCGAARPSTLPQQQSGPAAGGVGGSAASASASATTAVGAESASLSRLGAWGRLTASPQVSFGPLAQQLTTPVDVSGRGHHSGAGAPPREATQPQQQPEPHATLAHPQGQFDQVQLQDHWPGDMEAAFAELSAEALHGLPNGGGEAGAPGPGGRLWSFGSDPHVPHQQQQQQQQQNRQGCQTPLPPSAAPTPPSAESPLIGGSPQLLGPAGATHGPGAATASTAAATTMAAATGFQTGGGCHHDGLWRSAPPSGAATAGGAAEQFLAPDPFGSLLVFSGSAPAAAPGLDGRPGPAAAGGDMGPYSGVDLLLLGPPSPGGDLMADPLLTDPTGEPAATCSHHHHQHHNFHHLRPEPALYPSGSPAPFPSPAGALMPLHINTNHQHQQPLQAQHLHHPQHPQHAHAPAYPQGLEDCPGAPVDGLGVSVGMGVGVGAGVGASLGGSGEGGSFDLLDGWFTRGGSPEPDLLPLLSSGL